MTTDSIFPQVHPSALIGPGAVLQGQVTVGEDCFICPNAVLRGDIEPITLERGSNVQDCCVVHTSRGNPAVICEEASIGHGAVIHGATIGKSAMIGMNAVVLDGAVVGEEAVVGAGCVVPMGMTIPPRCLAVGTPARIVKEDDERIADIARKNGVRYLRYRDEHVAGRWGTSGEQQPKA
ncbi:MAG: gamma carbonic anhydrase family protein [Thermoplasmatota archaeon]